MESTGLVGLIKEFGLGVALALGTFGTLVTIIRWIMRQAEAIMKTANEQNEKWQAIFNRQIDSMNTHTAQSSEAHKLQKDEHYRQIALLDKICEKVSK